MPMTPEQERGLASHLQWRYGISLADVTPTSTPGYWRITTPCGGRAGGCRHPLHGFLFNEGETHHTVFYATDERAPNGRWISPYATWRAALGGNG